MKSGRPLAGQEKSGRAEHPHSHRKPFPGSNEALAQGCKCPVLDNGHGREYLGGVRDPETGETVYVVSQGCPLHWQEIADV